MRIAKTLLIGAFLLTGCRPAPAVTAVDVDHRSPGEPRSEAGSDTVAVAEPGTAPGDGSVASGETGRFPLCALPAPPVETPRERRRCAATEPMVAEAVFPHVDCTGVMSLDWPRAGNVIYVGTDAGLGSCHQTVPLVDRRGRERRTPAPELLKNRHVLAVAGSVGIDLWDMDCDAFAALLADHPASFDTILANGGPESVGGPLKSLSPELVAAFDRLATDDLVLDLALEDASELGSLERLAPKLHGLRLAFLPENVVDVDLSKLPEMPCLRLLSVAGYDLTLRNVSKLRDYPNLRFLSVHGTLPPDEVAGFESLDQVEELEIWLDEQSAWPDLRRLDGLRGLRGGEAISSRLVGLSKLERLLVGGVEDDDLERIGALRGLRGLELFLGEVTEQGLAHLDGLRSLRAIRIGMPQDEVAVMTHLGRLKELRTISVHDQEPIGDEGLAKLTGLGKLERIDTLLLLEDAGFRHLVKLQGLTALPRLLTAGADREFLRNTLLPAVVKLRNLRELDLSDADVVDDDLATLQTLTKLQTLVLDGTKVGDPGAAHLAKLGGLETLTLVGTDVSDAALDHLAKLSALEDLDLSDTKVTAKGVERLRSLSSLRRLGLVGTAITAAEAAILEKALPSVRVEVEGPD